MNKFVLLERQNVIRREVREYSHVAYLVTPTKPYLFFFWVEYL